MHSDFINNSFRLWAFRAIDEKELCDEYIKGHVKVLADYGISSITSNNKIWVENPFMYCVVIEDDVTKELLGGIRIQIADGISVLPVEKAIGNMDPRIYDLVKKYAFSGGVGELNGLWVSNKLKGVGIGPYLVRAAIASASQLNFVTMIGICGENTLQMFKNVGFLIENSLGKRGGFPYPSDDLTAHVVGILNAVSLESAAAFDKEIMVYLREKIISQRTEINNKYVSNISYNLLFKNVTHNSYGTQSVI
jgi:hypothetical protein